MKLYKVVQRIVKQKKKKKDIKKTKQMKENKEEKEIIVPSKDNDMKSIEDEIDSLLFKKEK